MESRAEGQEAAREIRVRRSRNAPPPHAEALNLVAGEIGENMPFMRQYARRISRDRSVADDLVQMGALRALTHANRFAPGTNLRAWITTILRNCYLNELRSGKRAPTTEFNELEHSRSASGGQEERLHFIEFCRSFDRLTAVHRHAIMSVAVEGASYEEAAVGARCAVGTMKSRVSRARESLAALDGL